MLSIEIKEKLKKMHLLIVDDSVDALLLLQTLLKSRFATVETSKSAMEALILIDSQHFDLIITDVNMPEMTGLEMVEKLRLKNFPGQIVFLSGHNEDSFLEKYAELRCLHMVKPFNANKFEKVINTIFGQQYAE